MREGPAAHAARCRRLSCSFAWGALLASNKPAGLAHQHRPLARRPACLAFPERERGRTLGALDAAVLAAAGQRARRAISDGGGTTLLAVAPAAPRTSRRIKGAALALACAGSASSAAETVDRLTQQTGESAGRDRRLSLPEVPGEHRRQGAATRRALAPSSKIVTPLLQLGLSPALPAGPLVHQPNPVPHCFPAQVRPDHGLPIGASLRLLSAVATYGSWPCHELSPCSARGTGSLAVLQRTGGKQTLLRPKAVTVTVACRA